MQTGGRAGTYSGRWVAMSSGRLGWPVAADNPPSATRTLPVMEAGFVGGDESDDRGDLV